MRLELWQTAAGATHYAILGFNACTDMVLAYCARSSIFYFSSNIEGYAQWLTAFITIMPELLLPVRIDHKGLTPQLAYLTLASAFG